MLTQLLGQEGFRRTANAFGSTFTFFTETQINTKKCKRATKLTQQDAVNNGQQSNDKKEQRRHNIQPLTRKFHQNKSPIEKNSLGVFFALGQWACLFPILYHKLIFLRHNISQLV